MTSTALVRSVGGGAAAEDKDKFEQLVLSFGNPNDIAVVADPKGQEIDVKVVLRQHEKGPVHDVARHDDGLCQGHGRGRSRRQEQV